MKSLYIITLLLLTACSHHTSSHSDASNEKKQPNVIVILLDDAGYADFGFMGSKDLETPHIDALARDGVIFTDAHVTASVCAPSRAGLMTGMYQQRFGFEANGTGDESSGDIGLADHVETLGEMMQSNGYKTIALGKWHLGGTESDHPNKRGFDEFYGFLAGSRSYFPLERPSKNRMLQHNGQRVIFEGYMTDVLGDASVRYVEENKDNPFFMYISYNAVHTPMHAKDEHLEKYKDHPRKELAAMTWSLDENIGKLRSKLKDLSLIENTLIFFLSDNGGARNNTSSMGPLKGTKGNKFEGGHRVPFIVSWPEMIEGGQSYHGLTSSLDIYATSVIAAGMPKHTLTRLDGVDLIPFLLGDVSALPHPTLFWRKLDESAIRHGAYKLISLRDFGSVLYNLDVDLGESQDLSSHLTTQKSNLQQQLKQWESLLLSPLWLEEPEWMEVTYHIHQRLMSNQEVLYDNPRELKRYKRSDN